MKTLLCMLIMASAASAAPGFRPARIYVGGGYGYYGPSYWGPRWYPGYAPYPMWVGGLSYRPGLGQVKLTTQSRDAEIFLDGSYAGVARDLKSLWLRPGSYDLEVREPGRASYHRRVYVITGKTLKIDTRERRP